ncbi:PAS domain S-box [Terriglobus roseus DSM 18391]|uniref:histidine kinase n=1 Tax=Terriglobus roseus (strain DSM 18391 / NRRL B-41598 / KBS 63) TaxID=926566 RepID=I3ZFF1_TERRK|nr:PAS domain S-box protein [Terriglobus roseus]AFL87969.1 PAS domain S-box [Terriglobus roseus DSM 18391]
MSMVVRVIAPSGRDAELILALLRQNSIASETCTDPLQLLTRGYDVGPMLIAEESLTSALIAALAHFVNTQPSWSDLPILILTTVGRETERTRRLERERLPIGAPILLERPIRTATLLSSVQAAVRARSRQYQVRDAIAERDQNAARLRAEQETLRTVLDSMPVGVAVAHANGEVVLTNAMLAQILRHEELPTPNFIAYSDWDTRHADGRKLTPEDYPLTRAIRSGRPVAGEDFLYHRGDGTTAWIRLSAAPIVDAEGEILGGVTAVIDVDQERKAAETLRRSEERFRLLIEQASVGIVIGDLGGSLSYMNPTLLRALGYTHEEMEQGVIRWDELTPPEYAELDLQAIKELQTVGVAQPYQKVYVARDGRRIPLLLGAVRIPAQEKTDHEEIAVFLTDLSSQKQAEAALIQSEKLAAVGRLAASISHEINNPLEAVTNLLYLARSEQTTAAGREYIEQASQELARVSQIAGQTLRFHRQSTRPRSVTPRELIEPVLALYEGRLRNARVRAISQHRGEPAFVCYEGDIRQVLNNLVGNAIDAMRGDGTLRIRSRAATDQRTGQSGVRITIADTGGGMSESTLQRIFEPFYTTKGIHGTGLGLWISQGIVEKHHGLLRARSREEGAHIGTVFTLFLPLEPGMEDR